MNVFYLNKSPEISAIEHCDKHAVKMCVEYAQLLSTAHRVSDGIEYIGKTKTGRRVKRWKHPNLEFDKNLMLASHVKHPHGIWCRETKGNYSWLLHLLVNLLKEYTHRYGKRHLVENRMPYLNFIPKHISQDMRTTEIPQCMPEYCKVPGNPIAAYHNYYIKEKVRFATWKKRSIPLWYEEKVTGTKWVST